MPELNAIVISLFGQWRHLVEAPVLVADVKKAVEKGSVPSFDFFFMLATAGVIATLGLLSNSAAVIIGAMIVAPLMNPIISLAFGVIEIDRVLVSRSLLTIVVATIVVVALFVPMATRSSRLSAAEARGKQAADDNWRRIQVKAAQREARKLGVN